MIRTGKVPDALAVCQPTSFPDDGANVFVEYEENSFWFEHRRQVVLDTLKKYAPTSRAGLDVGCGSGYLVAWLNQQGWKTYGVDTLPGIRADLSQQYPQHYGVFQISETQYSADFDFALLLDVVEHLPEPEKLVRRVFEMLKPGGVLIITAPAFQWLWSDTDNELKHLRRYQREEVSGLLKEVSAQARLHESRYLFWSIFPFYLLSRFYFKAMGRWTSKSTFAGQNAKIPILNGVFGVFLRMERFLTSCGLQLPWGSSVLWIIQKSE